MVVVLVGALILLLLLLPLLLTAAQGVQCGNAKRVINVRSISNPVPALTAFYSLLPSSWRSSLISVSHPSFAAVPLHLQMLVEATDSGYALKCVSAGRMRCLYDSLPHTYIIVLCN